MNIQSAINEASLKLKKNNIASPLIDSEILMTKVLNKKREYVILNIEKKSFADISTNNRILRID